MARTIYTGTATVGGTEVSLVNNSTSIASLTTPGKFCVKLDLGNLVVGNMLALYLREKPISGGTQRQSFYKNFRDVPSELGYESRAHVLLDGWDWTLQMTSGAAQDVSYVIVEV